MNVKIRWTDRERELVLSKATQLMHTGGYNIMEALRQAQQQVIVPDRRRPLVSRGYCVDLVKEVKHRAANVVPVKPAPVLVQAPKVEEPMPTPVSVLDHSTSLDSLINALAKQVAETFKQHVKVAIKELEHEFKVEKHNPTYAATGSFKPRVVIIGLLGDQVHSITKEFQDRYDIKCIDTDRAMGMEPPSANAYLLMKNFINHPLYHKYQVYPQHVLIDGGMSTLRMWLNTKGQEL
jgi:hypothetical protein